MSVEAVFGEIGESWAEGVVSGDDWVYCWKFLLPCLLRGSMSSFGGEALIEEEREQDQDNRHQSFHLTSHLVGYFGLVEWIISISLEWYFWASSMSMYMQVIDIIERHIRWGLDSHTSVLHSSIMQQPRLTDHLMPTHQIRFKIQTKLREPFRW